MISSSSAHKKMISSSDYNKVHRYSSVSHTKTQQKLSITKETTHQKLTMTKETTHQKNKHATDHKKMVGPKQEVVSRKTEIVKDRYISSAKKGVVVTGREEKHKSHGHLAVQNHHHHHHHHHGSHHHHHGLHVNVHQHIYHKPQVVVIKHESK